VMFQNNLKGWNLVLKIKFNTENTKKKTENTERKERGK